MRYLRAGILRPAGLLGPAAVLWIACAAASLAVPLAVPLRAMASDAVGEDHQQAVAALNDVKAAVAELVRADASYATDRNVYHRAAQRAINALVGDDSDEYAAGPGTAGDAAGAIGHIDSLLDRKETPVWAVPLDGAEANIRAAVAHLHDATKARELDGYQIAASRALTYLEVAQGRPTESDVFGGIEGALSNTVLGVPPGAQRQDACGTPAGTTPAYGTHGGYLAWVTVPATDAARSLAQATGGTELSVQNGMIVLRTAAAKLVAEACRKHAEADPADPGWPQPVRVELVAQTAPAKHPLPALYTKAQAENGKQIYATKCVSCHGADLQGTAAPSVAGNDFLVTAQHNGWTLSIIRYIVFNLMPRNSPASLSHTDDAALMAFLLASNCYPPSTKPFPPDDVPGFASIKLGPVPGAQGQNAKGVCQVN